MRIIKHDTLLLVPFIWFSNILWINGQIPNDHVCYLNDPNYKTKKFNSSIDDQSDPAWLCLSSDEKECFPKRYICDKTPDCPYGSDESKGCDLYPDTGCPSFFGRKFERKCIGIDRCYDIETFDRNRDCQDSAWKEWKSVRDWKWDIPQRSLAFHCSSGDFVPNSAVCNEKKECYDNSDEKYGCQLKQELENQRDDMCQNPEAVTNILGEDFDKNDMKLKELGLMRSTDGFDWPKQCDKMVVASSCNGTVSFNENTINVSSSEAKLACSWTIFAPHERKILLDFSGPFNSRQLNIYDGVSSTGQKLNEEGEYLDPKLNSSGNILRLESTFSETNPSMELLIHYKTTDAVDCLINTETCEIENSEKWGGKTCLEMEKIPCIPRWRKIGNGFGYFLAAILIFAILLVILFFVLFLFCLKTVTNTKYDGLCNDCREATLKEETNLSFVKYTTQMNIQLGFATFEVPSRIIDSLYLYETRLHIYKKGGDSIKSLLQIKYSKIDPENIPLTDSPVTRVGLALQLVGGCRTLTSENNLFQTTLHDDGKGSFSIDMKTKPIILPYLADRNKLYIKDDIDDQISPFKASLIFKTEQREILLGHVRDKHFNVVCSFNGLSDSTEAVNENMELLKTIEDDQEVDCYSESSEDEQTDVQPTNIKSKKVDKNGIKKPISKDFDTEFNFFANAKGGTSDYLADSWCHVSAFMKKKNSNRTSVDAKIKKLKSERKTANNNEEINADSSGESSDELSEDELVHDDINIKKLSKNKKKAAENGEEKSSNPEIVVAEEDEKEQDDEDFFDLPDVAELAQAEANKTFYSMNLSRPLLKAVDALQYVHPTPIQSATIPIALSGRDVCGCAATGTGKTAAYMLPVLERLLFRPKEDSVTRVLLLVPTRELGVQVFQVTKQLCQFTTIDVALSVGGLDLRLQEAALRKNPDIVIATPGRLIDHIKNTPSFGLDSIEVLILDEADRLLEEAFLDQIKEIVKSCAPTRQTMLFSATMTDQVNELAAVSLRRPVKIFVDSNKAVAWNLQQEFVRIRPTHEKESEAVLAALLTRTCRDHAIVFIRTKYACHRLHIVFGLLGLRVAELHGNMSQTQRLESLRAFRDGTVDILLTTDVAARGLDIVGVKTVVNFQLPNTLEQYIHRVGRTARAGRAGRSVSFATENQRKIVRDIVKHARRPVKARVIPPKIIQKYFKRISELEQDVARILEEESAEKEIAKLENRANRMQNQLETGTQERTWMEKKKNKKSNDKKDVKELKGKKKKRANVKKNIKDGLDPSETKEHQNLASFSIREAKRDRKLKRIRAVHDNDNDHSGKKKRK